MACYHPLRAFQRQDGTVLVLGKTSSSKPPRNAKALQLPCGQCIGCRLQRSYEWAKRCMDEASLYHRNCFITLTYDNQHLPHDLSLRKRDFQLFMKRLRRRFFASSDMPIRYYMCGEYGEGRGRPHYHACLFNFDFKDKLYFKRTSGLTLYTSKTLDDLWGMGFSLIGAVTLESAAYVARYCTDRVTGPDAAKAYRLIDKTTGETYDRIPEYNDMSRRPGIGADWLHKYTSDVYPHGSVIINGRHQKPPRYYDNLFRKHYDNNDIIYNQIKAKREQRAIIQLPDNTRARRAVKEQVATARLMAKRKSLL